MTPPAPTPIDPQRNEGLALMARAVAEALSLRAILLLTVLGAFVLAVMAMSQQTPWALATLALYSFSAIPAVVYLEIKRRQ